MVYSRNIAISKAAQIHTALSTDCIIATYDTPSVALLANVFQHAPPVCTSVPDRSQQLQHCAVDFMQRLTTYAR